MKAMMRISAPLCEMRSFAQIFACKWLPSPSARYAVVRASTCECARSARDVRDPTVQTRSQYRSKRFRKPGGDINDAEDSIREGAMAIAREPAPNYVPREQGTLLAPSLAHSHQNRVSHT
jgi:hypothetical protein